MREKIIVGLCLAALAAAGCGGSNGPRKYGVSGAVTFDGKPIERGFITLQASSPPAQSEGAKIADGAFSLTAIPGEYKVEIRGVRSVPFVEGKTSGLMVDENYVPDRYNQKTELVAKVTNAEKDNVLKFELTSKP